MLTCDVIKRLCDALVHFKGSLFCFVLFCFVFRFFLIRCCSEYDTVLAKVYRYMGPSFNFGFVSDLVTALHNIVNVGFMVSGTIHGCCSVFVSQALFLAEQTGENNQYALKFTMGDLDQIKNLLNLMASNVEQEKVQKKKNPMFRCFFMSFFEGLEKSFAIRI